MTPLVFRPVTYDASKGYPAGSDIVYVCKRCGEMLPSIPPGPVQCSCRNVRVDVDAGRVSVDDHSQFAIGRIARENHDGG
jgi:hypothetical protein